MCRPSLLLFVIPVYSALNLIPKFELACTILVQARQSNKAHCDRRVSEGLRKEPLIQMVILNDD